MTQCKPLKMIFSVHILYCRTYSAVVFHHFQICKSVLKYVALLHIIVTFIKENVITKLQKLYSPARKFKTGNKLSVLLLKKSLCIDSLLPMYKIFTEKPA